MIACTFDVVTPITSQSIFTSQDALVFLEKCSSLNQLKQTHAKIIRHNLHKQQIIAARLIRICSFYNELDYASLILQQIENPSTFLSNLLIRACNYNNYPRRAILLYNSMVCRGVTVDKFTFPFVMKSCLASCWVEKAREIYGFAIRKGFHRDVYLDNVFMDLCMKCGVVDDGLKVFDKMRVRTVVSWTTIVSGLIHNGNMDLARQFFDKMPSKNVISWTSMINGYAKTEEPEKAFEVFLEMQHNGVKPNEYTLVSLLVACAELGSLKLGRWVHDYAIKNGIEIGTFLGTALIDMYSKCGSVEYAKRVFRSMEVKSVATWNIMITSLGVHGQGEEALSLFEEMERSSNVKPDEITFVGVLCACQQMNDVEKGRKYFNHMMECYGIKPIIEHYACLFEMNSQPANLIESEF